MMSIDQVSDRITAIEARLKSLGVTQSPDLDGYLQRLEARISEVEQRVLTLEGLVRPVEGFDVPPPALPGAVEVPLIGSDPVVDADLPSTVGDAPQGEPFPLPPVA